MYYEDYTIIARTYQGFYDWEQRKLGESFNVMMGQSPRSENYTDNPDDYILVQGNADLKNGRISPRVWTTQVTKTASKRDIILSVRAPVGDVAKTQFDVVLGRGVAGIKGNDFLFHLLNKMKLTKFWTKFSTGSTFESINSSDLKDAIINLPNIAEQSVIGNFFEQMDGAIVLHQRKLLALESLKEAYLQNMFPKKEESEPKLRFANFSEDWEQRKLGDIAPLQRGFDLPKTKIKNGPYPVVFSNGIGAWNSKHKVKGPGVVTGRSGSIGNVFFLKEHFWPHNTTLWVTNFMGSNPLFIYYLYRKVDLSKFGTGSGVPTLNRNDVHDSMTHIANPAEQSKIAIYLSKLDNTIALHQQKLDQLKKLQKAYLQKVFI